MYLSYPGKHKYFAVPILQRIVNFCKDFVEKLQPSTRFRIRCTALNVFYFIEILFLQFVSAVLEVSSIVIF